jgi:AcrR family transcriptional regulator
MKSTEDRRAALLDRLADHVLSHGLVASSLRPLAKAAQTSDRMLLYYFADKAEIIAATLQVVATRMVVAMNAKVAANPLPFDVLLAHLSGAMLTAEFWPFMRVWLEIVSRAASGDPFYTSIGEQIGRGFLAWGAGQLDSSDDARRAQEAARLLVAIEGAVLLKAIGMADVARGAYALRSSL